MRTARADRPAQPHRLPVAEVHRHRAQAHGEPARRRRGRGGQGDPRPARRRTSTSPTTCSRYYREAGARGRGAREAWEQRRAAFTDVRARRWPPQLDACLERRGLAGWEAKLPAWEVGEELATRAGVRARSLDAVLDVVPGLSAAAPTSPATPARSSRTRPSSPRTTSAAASIHFGIREHGMGAVMNGMAVPAARCPPAARSSCSATTCGRAVRLAALSQYQGRCSCGRTTPSASARTARPTSRSSSSRRCGRCRGCASSARPTPTRPRQAWRVALDGDGPTALILTRQNAPGARAAPPSARPRASPAAPTCSSTKTATASTSCSSAPGPRSQCASTPRELLAATGCRCGWCRCRRGTSSPRSPTSTATRCCRADVPTLAVEAGATLRLGALRRRRRRHRPLRRLGARAGRPGEVRLHPRARRGPRATLPWSSTEQEAPMTQRRSPGSTTTSGRARGTTTSPVPLLTGGGLAKLVEVDGIRGVTSNPTIFDKAIGAGEGYDEQLRASCATDGALDRGHVLGARGRRHRRRRRRAPPGLRRAATAATASCRVEVAPDRSPTTPTAPSRRRHRLHDQVDRPNLSSRSRPRSRASPPSSRCIAEGITVNVTLIFSLDRHAEVIEAYLTGLERLRRERAATCRAVASVASFFVSRVDTETDRRLPEGTARCGARRRSPTPSSPTSCSASGSPATAGTRSRRRARGCSGRCGRRRRPRTRRTPDTLYVDELDRARHRQHARAGVDRGAAATATATSARHRHRGRRRRPPGDGRSRRGGRRLSTTSPTRSSARAWAASSSPTGTVSPASRARRRAHRLSQPPPAGGRRDRRVERAR